MLDGRVSRMTVSPTATRASRATGSRIRSIHSASVYPGASFMCSAMASTAAVACAAPRRNDSAHAASTQPKGNTSIGTRATCHATDAGHVLMNTCWFQNSSTANQPSIQISATTHQRCTADSAPESRAWLRSKTSPPVRGSTTVLSPDIAAKTVKYPTTRLSRDARSALSLGLKLPSE